MDEFVSAQLAWSLLGILALGGSITWVVLCVKGIIPERWSRWTLLGAGVVGTLGLWILAKVLTQKPEMPSPSPIVIDRKGPSKEEVKDLDDRAKDLDTRIKDTREKLEEIDDRADSAGDLLDDDNINPDFRRRIEELRKQRRGRGDLS